MSSTEGSGYSTAQEAFWAGEFGTDYSQRNVGPEFQAAKLAMFARILGRTRGVRSVIELGANVGLNLTGMRALLPNAELAAVEINPHAAQQLRALPDICVYQMSLLDFRPTRTWDLAFCAGVLIHIAPAALAQAYHVLHRASARYVCLIEYYNPAPVEVPYRGHHERLFKRDFAGEMRVAHPGLQLIDYGFVYRGDPVFPLDDLTWFLMEKH